MLLLLGSACSKQRIDKRHRSDELTVNQMKDVLLKNRTVYSVDRNLDQNNPIEIKFEKNFADQLIEFNFETKKMNTAIFKVINSSLSKSLPDISVTLGEMKISLDDNDITACVISECNQTQCDGTGALTDISENMNTGKIYLNLSKMDQNTSTACTNLNLETVNAVHSLKLEEIGGRDKGARVFAQVVVYNRTYFPENIMNVFEASLKGGRK